MRYMPDTFTVFTAHAGKPDGMGGKLPATERVLYAGQYIFLDMLNGDIAPTSNEMAEVRQSTHVAVWRKQDMPTPPRAMYSKLIPEINDLFMRNDRTGESYKLTYIDDPVSVGHHLELFAKFVSEVV